MRQPIQPNTTFRDRSNVSNCKCVPEIKCKIPRVPVLLWKQDKLISLRTNLNEENFRSIEFRSATRIRLKALRNGRHAVWESIQQGLQYYAILILVTCRFSEVWTIALPVVCVWEGDGLYKQIWHDSPSPWTIWEADVLHMHRWKRWSPTFYWAHPRLSVL